MRETGGQTNRQTGRQADRYAQRERGGGVRKSQRHGHSAETVTERKRERKG